MSCEEKMIDGAWNINFNGRWYVMEEIGLIPAIYTDCEVKVEDGMEWIGIGGHWYPGHDVALDYFPFADLSDDELNALYDDATDEPTPVPYYECDDDDMDFFNFYERDLAPGVEPSWFA